MSFVFISTLVEPFEVAFVEIAVELVADSSSPPNTWPKILLTPHS